MGIEPTTNGSKRGVRKQQPRAALQIKTLISPLIKVHPLRISEVFTVNSMS